MKRIRRAPAMIAAAILLPLLIFLGIQIVWSAGEQRSIVETQAMARTSRILAEADGHLQRTLGALEVLASAQALEDEDWPGLYERLQRVRRSNPEWVTAVVTDLRTRQSLLDLRTRYGEAGQAGFGVPAELPRGGRPFVGGMGGNGAGCPCALVHLPVERNGRPSYVITVALDSEPFRRVLVDETGDSRVMAIVDASGRFVARSLNHRERVGAPATIYVRNAIASAPSGIYRGRTFEGFANYSAYSTSPLSGWSAHVAFSPGLLDSPRWRSLVAAGFAALASLLLATVLAMFTLRQLAAGRRVQERLQEAQKMEALGQITGGIAHDFNNLLTPIIGGLEVVARKEKLEGVSARLLDSALSSARRAAKLTGQLLAFSRRQRLEIRAVDLPRLLADLQPLLAQSAGPAIRIETTVDPAVACVSTDANQLELALLNLVLNARDAMPGGGSISISATREPGRRGETDMVVLALRDTGQGMPADVLRRATEPFFTTKGAGRGTGLGLAQVYGTVHQSGGTIAIASAPQEGTTVTLRLPACQHAPAPPVEADAPNAVEEGRNRRILLCDDDDLVRGFVVRVLDAAGYVVEAVSSGRAAVELARVTETDLLLVDFAMPGMDGVQVMQAVRELRPDLPVLMITGYADTGALAQIAPDTPVLRKPFDAGTLLRCVHETIDGKPAAVEAGSIG